MELKELFKDENWKAFIKLQEQYRKEYPEPPTFLEWLKRKNLKSQSKCPDCETNLVNDPIGYSPPCAYCPKCEKIVD